LYCYCSISIAVVADHPAVPITTYFIERRQLAAASIHSPDREMTAVFFFIRGSTGGKKVYLDKVVWRGGRPRGGQGGLVGATTVESLKRWGQKDTGEQVAYLRNSEYVPRDDIPSDF
jgi:hypothetical protein